MSRSRSLATAFTFFLVAITFVGCGESDGKINVTGTVTWNGAPLESGDVIFEPINPAAPEAAQLAGGKYSLRVLPGEYRVSIQAQKEDGWDKGMNQPNYVQFIPDKYNVKTELTANVAEGGENDFEFKLEGDGA